MLHPFPLAAAGDGAGLAWALRQPGVTEARRILVLAKVPGPATLNDSCRELTQAVFRDVAAQAGDALLGRCRFLLSVGCEGVGSAGGWLLADDGLSAGAGLRLAMGMAETDVIASGDRGTPAHADAVAAATLAAMADAGLDRDAVRLVLVKSPVRRDQANATGQSRGTAALGVAAALGERTGFCTRAMAMSGTETERAEVAVFGNREGAGGALVIGSGLLRDIIDVRGARRTLTGLGARFDADGVLADPAALPLVLFKAGLRPDGLLRGRPTHAHGTDMPTDKHLRAAASGMLAALLGSNDAFITGGAEHQAPPGGCLLAAVARA